MKAIPVHQVKIGQFLAQNIYRHDGLLMYPKGYKLRRMEIEYLSESLEYILVEDHDSIYKHDNIHVTLDIVRSAYQHTSLWKQEVGIALYEGLEKIIVKNKKVQKYLAELRALDNYSFVHCINVSIIVSALLMDENKVDKSLIYLAFLTLMHDIGRIKMKHIFRKEGKLTEDEFKELRKHPQYSFKLLKTAGIAETDLGFVLEHHERFDGSGYPLKLKGFEIAELAQLILIADFYNGLSSDRPYRRAFSPDQVCDMIEQEKHIAFGEKYIQFFLHKFVPYPVGIEVELSNGDTAIVKRMNEARPLFPVVEIQDARMMKPVTVNLAMETQLKIKRIITVY